MSTKTAMAESTIRIELQDIELMLSNFRKRMHAEIEDGSTVDLKLRLSRMRNAISKIDDQLEIIDTEAA